MHYFELLASMWHLLKTTPILRRRAAYQACMFGAFSLFWTCVSLELTGPHFGISQTGVAIFALVGVTGRWPRRSPATVPTRARAARPPSRADAGRAGVCAAAAGAAAGW
jgi:hypothetical protein